MIRLAQPALDLLLATGERVSRIVERDDSDWMPPRSVASPPAPLAVGRGSSRADEPGPEATTD